MWEAGFETPRDSRQDCRRRCSTGASTMASSDCCTIGRRRCGCDLSGNATLVRPPCIAVHGWTRVEGRWQEVTRQYAGVVEMALGLEGKPVSSARYPELQLAEQHQLARRDPSLPRPVFDLLGPEGGLLRHSEYGEQGAMLVPFSDEWEVYFPDRPWWRPPTWPFPRPDGVEFMRGYGEPLSAIVDAAAELSRILSLIAVHRPNRRPPSRSQRPKILAALRSLRTLAGPMDEDIDMDEKGGNPREHAQ